jgi:hypothetical protein
MYKDTFCYSGGNEGTFGKLKTQNEIIFTISKGGKTNIKQSL